MPTIATIWPTISKLFCAACDARTDLGGGVIVKQHCESRVHKGQVIEHSVHGLVTIRLEGAPVRIVEAIIGQLGPSQTPCASPSTEPDITVSFSEKLSTCGELRLLELNQAAFDDKSFYLLDGEGHRARIDFSSVGEPCHVECELGINSVPLLLPLVGLRLLRKGYVLLHSAAFVYRGEGILVTGWQKGGKTEMLLSFMQAGARYVSDEWTIVGGEPPRLYGLAGRVKVWDWHLHSLPRYLARIPSTSKYRLRLLWLYRKLMAQPGLSDLKRGPFGLLHELSREAGSVFLGLVSVSPNVLFAGNVWAGAAPLDRVFLALLGQDGIEAQPADPSEIARRMVSSLAYERSSLLEAYHKFRFAFPDRSNMLIETAQDREQEILLGALAGKPSYEIRHPYPVSLAAMYAAAASCCGREK